MRSSGKSAVTREISKKDLDSCCSGEIGIHHNRWLQQTYYKKILQTNLNNMNISLLVIYRDHWFFFLMLQCLLHSFFGHLSIIWSGIFYHLVKWMNKISAWSSFKEILYKIFSISNSGNFKQNKNYFVINLTFWVRQPYKTNRPRPLNFFTDFSYSAEY